MWKRNIKYWGRISLENMGICLGLSLVLMIFFAAGSFQYAEGGIFGDLQIALFLYPYYLALAGGFYLFISTATYFRSYLPVLLSMNATRSRAVLGLVFHVAAMVLGITAVSALIWMTALGKEAGAAGFLPVLAGALLLMGAAGLVLGAVSARWGTVGTVIVLVVCAAIGGMFGAGVALSGTEKVVQVLETIAEARFLWMLALGAAAFVLAGAFALALNRKMEVRV